MLGNDVAVKFTANEPDIEEDQSQPETLLYRLSQSFPDELQRDVSFLFAGQTAHDQGFLFDELVRERLLLRVWSCARDEYHYPAAGVENLGVEVHGCHQFSNGTAGKVDQDEDSVLVVLEAAAICDEEDVDVDQNGEGQTDKFTDHLHQQESPVGFQLLRTFLHHF